MTRRTALALAATVLIGLAAYGLYANYDAISSRVAGLFGAEDGGETQGPRATPVAVAETRSGVAVERFRTSGEVVARQNVMLSAEIAGRVAEIYAEDGGRLEQGDRVLHFAAGPERAALDAAESRLGEAEADLRRQRTLQDENVVAEARVETARAQARAARSEVEQARAALEDQTVRAPFDGQLGLLQVSEGAYLSPGSTIARFASVDRLRVRFTLPQRAADAARGSGEVAVEGVPEPCRRAEIAVASPLTADDTRTRSFEADLAEACDLSPGAFVTVSVPLERREDAVFAPHAAVVREGFDSWVYRVADGEQGPTARRAPVETGVFAGDEIEIRSGLEGGQRIVARGVQKVSDGALLRPLDDASGDSGGQSGGTSANGGASGGADPGDAEPGGEAAARGSGGGADRVDGSGGADAAPAETAADEEGRAG